MPTATLKQIQFPTHRRALNPEKKSYELSVGAGVTLGYYRPVTLPGSWKAIFAVPGGKRRTFPLGRADDTEAADGVRVLTYADARREVEKRASERGKPIATRPITIDEALTEYRKDLIRRGGNPANADNIRYHLGDRRDAEGKPVEVPSHADFKHLLPLSLSTVTEQQLKTWRNGLLDNGMKASTYNRLMTSVHAAFNAVRAARGNAEAWKFGLEFLSGNEANIAREVEVTPAQIRAIVAEAHNLRPRDFGPYVQVHAETGARSNQIARITVGDLRGNILKMPNSGKGNPKTVRKATAGKTPIALTPDLAARLAELAGDRPAHELLLRDFTDPIGRSWETEASQSQSQELLKKVLKRLSPAQVPQPVVDCYGKRHEFTLVWFRHAAIQRALEANVPVSDIATIFNTSISQIAKHYSQGMKATALERMRPVLLETGPGANVVTLDKAG